MFLREPQHQKTTVKTTASCEHRSSILYATLRAHHARPTMQGSLLFLLWNPAIGRRFQRLQPGGREGAQAS